MKVLVSVGQGSVTVNLNKVVMLPPAKVSVAVNLKLYSPTCEIVLEETLIEVGSLAPVNVMKVGSAVPSVWSKVYYS